MPPLFRLTVIATRAKVACKVRENGMPDSQLRKGSCLCGKITLEVTGPMRDVLACHCSQCRKQTGSYYHGDQCAR